MKLRSYTSKIMPRMRNWLWSPCAAPDWRIQFASSGTVRRHSTPLLSGCACESRISRHHFTVYYADASNNLYIAASSLPVTTNTLDLSSIVPPGTWNIYVEMSGQPLIINRISNAVTLIHWMCTARCAQRFPSSFAKIILHAASFRRSKEFLPIQSVLPESRGKTGIDS